MHVDNIEADLARGDHAGIEDAFRALVSFPWEQDIIGVETADHLSRLLRLCAEALAGDGNQLPGSVRDILDDVAGEGDQPETYAAGAAVALAHAAHFHDVFDRNLISAV